VTLPALVGGKAGENFPVLWRKRHKGLARSLRFVSTYWMAQHFWLSPRARSLSLAEVFRLSDAEAEATFRKIR
jgi:hypothetical protein